VEPDFELRGTTEGQIRHELGFLKDLDAIEALRQRREELTQLQLRQQMA
jgi:hypothetical protein